MNEVMGLMRGNRQQRCDSTIQHEHDTSSRTMELVREIIEIESILGDERGPDGRWKFRLPVDPRIAHVRIIMFGDRTA